jgi:serine/threonine protein kinase
MSISIPEFWNLATESRLLTLDEVERLAIAFSQIKGAAAQANAPALAEWLIAQNVLSRYQASLLLAGQRGPFWFGVYKVYARVETGSLAGAYRAVHGPTGHTVLLEFVSAADAADLTRWSGISSRARRALAVNHPHLRRCHELVDLGRYKFLVTEDPPGRSLDTYLASGRPLGAPDACRLTRQIALALSSWHAAEFVHGGLVPDQVFITPTGNVRLVQPALAPAPTVDFAVLGRSDDAARRLIVLLDYLAPERFQPGRAPDVAADVYGLGCLLHQLLTGRVPFPGGDVRQKAIAHATLPIASLAPFGVPEPLAQVVAYMMAKDASLRYATAAKAADALAPFVPQSALVPAIEPVPQAAAMYQAGMARRVEQPTQVAEPSKPAAVAAVTPAVASKTGLSGTPQISVPVVSGDVVRPSRRRSSALSTIIGGGVATLVALGFAIYLYATSGDPQPSAASSRPEPKAPQVTPRDAKERKSEPSPPNPVPPSIARPKKQTPPSPPAPNAQKTKLPESSLPPEEVIDDDQKMLWASPTSGLPLSLAHVGLGAQAALILRPAQLMADGEGSRIIKSLGPAGEQFVAGVESAIGVRLADVEQLVIALYPNGDLPPRASYVVRLKSEVAETTLAKNWKNVSPSKTRDGKKLYAGEAYAYYLPPAEKGRVFAAGVIETIQEIAELDGKEPTLVVPLVKLLRSGDADRQLTFVCEPRLLFGDGRKLFAGVAEGLREPLSRFLGDDVLALATSLHLADDRLFLELRAIGRLETKPDDLARSLAGRVKDLARRMDDFALDTEISRHSKKLINRFPQMLRELAAFLRVDTAADEAVLRCYLPAVAAHNLARAAELALHESAGATMTVAQTPVAVEPAPVGLAGKLEKKITLAFPRDTLEKSIELWAAEVGVRAVILGNDLQLEGITKNQSFGLEETDQPAAAVLRAILKKASPDGKLIYVIKPEQPGGADVVFITTLAAAVKRGDKLPSGFQAPKTLPKRKV